jgi:hypothetical protein
VFLEAAIQTGFTSPRFHFTIVVPKKCNIASQPNFTQETQADFWAQNKQSTSIDTAEVSSSGAVHRTGNGPSTGRHISWVQPWADEDLTRIGPISICAERICYYVIEPICTRDGHSIQFPIRMSVSLTRKSASVNRWGCLSKIVCTLWPALILSR